jgi:class 3 adenylate cyclase/tetratricopeptide (TPR) repeat protein
MTVTSRTFEPGPIDEASPSPSDVLTAYVPRLVIEWLRDDPTRLHRELDGTFVFVDISGFTALSERLARKGKIGAELMRDTLDGVFKALLDEAYDWGAGLLKWGGDALLLLFDGPDHDKRACRAAWEMQRTIDRVGRLHLSSGTLTLRMSVGIGTGTFHFFLTGSVHRELLIGGPAMTETLQMEAIADATEIGITETLARRLDPACVGPRKDAAILLAAPPEVDRRRAPDVGDTTSIDIASCIPVATRAHVLLRKSEPEHRTITAAFIDMMSIDELLAELGPQRLGEGVDERIRQIEEAALQFEVPFYETDVGKSSVKALLTAGAPSSTGHDEERMLRTLRTVMEQPGIVPMRIGVNTGKVFTGDFGPRYRRAYRVFGDAINTAARVMSKAEAGQILSTEIVLNRSKTVFDTTPIEPFAAKGKAALVHASIVGPVIGTKESDRTVLPLVGRDAELRTLVDAVESTQSGHGILVEMIGESGIGKTRLLDEVINRSPGVRVLRTRGEEYESSTPYFAMRAVMRAALDLAVDAETSEVTSRLHAVVDRVDPELRPWIPLLGILLGIDLPATPETAALEERFIRDRLAEVAWTFLAKTLPGPTLLAVDDSHHLDESTHDLLLRLFQSRGTRRAMLVLLHTASDQLVDTSKLADPDACVVLRLPPLSAEARLELIDTATEDAPLRPHEAEAIADRSGGNPLFLRDLVDAVRASGSIDSLPDSVESLIAGEIDRLAPTDRMILRYAAVLGTRFDPDLLEDAVSADVDLDPEVWDRLAALVRPDRVGGFRFESKLVRDAAYEGLPYRRRRALHERVAESIEANAGESVEEEIPSLALHYYEAQRWDKAWSYTRLAGERAARVYANADAARFYSEALSAVRHLRVPPDERVAVHMSLSDAYRLLGRYEDSDATLGGARKLLKGDVLDAAPIVIAQAILPSRQARFRQTTLRVNRALRQIEGREGPDAAAFRARLQVINAGTRYFQNRQSDAISWAKRAEAEARRSDAKDALAQAYKLLDLSYKENGEIEKAVYSARALRLYEELGDLTNQALVLNNQGIIAQELSRWDEALDLYRRSLEIMDRIGNRAGASLAKYNVAEILGDQGHLDEAEALLREVLRVWRAQGADADVADARRELGKVLTRRGEFEASREQLDLALEGQVRDGRTYEALATTARLLELDVALGSGPEALSRIEEAVANAPRVEGGSVFAPALARLRGAALIQAGRLDEGAAELRTALEAARKRGDAHETTLLLDVLVRLGDRAGLGAYTASAELGEVRTRLGITTLLELPLGNERTAQPS